MTNAPKFDYRHDYDQALKGLEQDAGNTALQHQAVLALARAGSLAMAQSEFQRYGLSDVHDEEDILGLGARLLKDAYLESDAPTRNNLARQAASQYQSAFQKTGGFYSGINAATMELLADGDVSAVADKSEKVLRILPNTSDLSTEELYFVEATRAEALLLSSNFDRAKRALQVAWRHDPLNYTAHASTLRQLKVICEHMSVETKWLDEFMPPRTAHYAGHVFSTTAKNKSSTTLSEQEERKLQVDISNSLQKHDVGFGYGALSAGSDILVAEALIEEGAEVHVLLPVAPKHYRAASVRPFGKHWARRFDECVSNATSVSILKTDAKWPDRDVNRYAGKISMGNAIIQANFLSTSKMQLLILNPQRRSSYTSDHMHDWDETGYDTIQLPLQGTHTEQQEKRGSSFASEFRIELQSSDGSVSGSYKSVRHAALAALQLRATKSQSLGIGLHCSFRRSAAHAIDAARKLASSSVPGGIVLSGEFAALLTAEAERELAVSYVGQIDLGEHGIHASYNLKKVVRTEQLFD